MGWAAAGRGGESSSPAATANNEIVLVVLQTLHEFQIPIHHLAVQIQPKTIRAECDGEVLAIGSPGADRITSAIATVLLNHVVCGMDLADAVASPREVARGS